jgi:hypothetical protein
LYFWQVTEKDKEVIPSWHTHCLIFNPKQIAGGAGQKRMYGARLMPKTMDNRRAWTQINLIDAFLYLLAGSAMLIISVSFLLWLRF